MLTLCSDNYKWNTTTDTEITINGRVATLPYGIEKASVTLSNLTIPGWTYNTYNKDVNIPGATVTKNFTDSVVPYFQYSIDGEEWLDWNENTMNNLTVKTYRIRAVVDADPNYYGATLEKDANGNYYTFSVSKNNTAKIEGVASSGYETSYSPNGYPDLFAGVTTTNGYTPTYTYQKKNAQGEYEGVGAITDAGDYLVTITLNGGGNYNNDVVENIPVTINKVAVDETAIPDYGEVEYGTKLSDLAKPSYGTGIGTWTWETPDATVGDVNGNNRTHKLVFTPSPNYAANYEGGEFDITFTVYKKVILTPSATNIDRTYDGKTTHYSGLSAVAGVYTMSGDGRINAGDQTVTLTLENPNNYAWDSLTNTSETTTVEYTVAQAQITFTGVPTITGWSYGTYDAIVNKPSNTVVQDYAKDKVYFLYLAQGETEWKRTVPTNAGTTHKVKAVVDNDANGNYLGAESAGRTFAIAKAQVVPPSVVGGIKEQQYNKGEKVLYTLSGVDDSIYTVTDNGTGNAGDQKVKLALIDSTNYEWSTTLKSEPIEITYGKITPATVTFSNLAINGWTYGQTANKPSVTTNFTGYCTPTFVYSATQNGTYTATIPNNGGAGTYYVKATVAGGGNFSESFSAPVSFTIEKAKPMWDDVFSGKKFYEYQLKELISNPKVYNPYNKEAVAGSFNFDFSTLTTGVNTITLTFTPSDNNYVVSDTKTYRVQLVAVAYLNNVTPYISIEAALNAASTANKDTVWVRPYDPQLGPIYITQSVTVKSGVTLILPYGGGEWTRNTIDPKTGVIDVYFKSTSQYTKPADEGQCSVKVIIADGIKLTNNGIIEIAGQLSGGSGAAQYAGFTAGKHARLVLGEKAEIINNGTIYAAGFIRELDLNNGSKVTLNEGSYLYQPFTLRDFPGGSVSYATYKTLDSGEPITSFSRFIMMNVSSEVHINYGGSVKAWAILWAGSQNNQTVGDMIGFGANNTTSVIALTNATYSYMTAKYDVDSETCKLDIYGGAKTNAMKLSLELGLLGGGNVDISTEKALFAISHHYDVTLHKSDLIIEGQAQQTAEFTMGQKFKVMTGAKFTVEEGAKLTIGDLIIYENFEDIRSDAGTSQDHPMRYPNKPAAIFTVNGELVATNLGGMIYSDNPDAIVTISGATVYTAYELKKSSGSGITASVDERNPITVGAVVFGTTNLTAPSGVTTTTITLDLDYDGKQIPMTVFSNNSTNYPTLPTPERRGYEFVGWKYDNADVVSGSAFVASGAHTLTAQWVPIIEVGLDADRDGVADDYIYVRPSEAQVYTLTAPTMEGYEFLGWFYGETPVSSGDALLSNTHHTLTAKWQRLIHIGLDTDGDGTANSYVYVDPDGQLKYTLTAATMEGYQFLGWFYGEEEVKTGEALRVTYDPTDDTSADHILTAKWQRLIHIGLDTDGDGTADSYAYVDPDGELKYTLSDPGMEGHEFLGWYYREESVSSGDALKVTYNPEDLTSADHVLTATWKRLIHIGLDNNTDGIVDSYIYIDPEGALVYPNPLPTPTGDENSRFDGWYYVDEDSNVIKVTAGEGLNGRGDHTLVARWEKKVTVFIQYGDNLLGLPDTSVTVWPGESVSIGNLNAKDHDITVAQYIKALNCDTAGVTFTVDGNGNTVIYVPVGAPESITVTATFGTKHKIAVTQVGSNTSKISVSISGTNYNQTVTLADSYWIMPGESVTIKATTYATSYSAFGMTYYNGIKVTVGSSTGNNRSGLLGKATATASATVTATENGTTQVKAEDR